MIVNPSLMFMSQFGMSEVDHTTIYMYSTEYAGIPLEIQILVSSLHSLPVFFNSGKSVSRALRHSECKRLLTTKEADSDSGHQCDNIYLNN